MDPRRRHYLARGVDAKGRFRYLVDAPTNRTLPGYDWPRHAGATYFLAQAAALAQDAELGQAAVRAASFLRDHAMVACGDHRCIGDTKIVDVGSTALALLAFVEIARTKLDPSFAPLVPPLTAFLRGQQRPDGEFMHEYDRAAQRPIDVQLLYYTGEAALALSRAASLEATRATSTPRGAPSRASSAPGGASSAAATTSAKSTGPARPWRTCGIARPNDKALDFCVRWQAYDRKLQYTAEDSPYDAEGMYGFGPLVTPRLHAGRQPLRGGHRDARRAPRASGDGSCGVAPGSSGGSMARCASRSPCSFATSSGPGPRTSSPRPAAVEGAMPGSEVDWQLRIDYAQHTGSAMIRWLSGVGAVHGP